MNRRRFGKIATVATASMLLIAPAAILGQGSPPPSYPAMPTIPGMPAIPPSYPAPVPPGNVAPPGYQQPGGNQGPPMAECAPGVMPTRNAPCMIPPCPEGVNPSPTAPCIGGQGGPGGPGGQGGQGDKGGQGGNAAGPMSAPPPTELTKKTFVMNVEIEGSGDDPATFEASLVKVVRGVKKEARDFMTEELEGESFVISAGTAKCFADSKKDANLVPDETISCAKLSDLVDNVSGSINATFTGKMVFDASNFTPSFKAKKIVMLGKSFKF